MDLAFSEAQELLRATTRKFLESEAPPERTRALFEDPAGFDLDVWRRGAELGWCAPAVPAEHGGGSVSGQPVVDLVAIAEELGRVAYSGPFLATNVVALAVAEIGSDEQRKEVLPGIASGETVAAWCVAEAAGGWAPEDMRTRATRDGGDVILDGSKSYVEAAGAATWLLVAAAGEGLTQVLVPADAPGITVNPLETLDLTRRLSEVTFEGVRLPASAVLGEPGRAAGEVERQTQVAMVLLCADSVGAASRVLELSVQYAKDRVQFGRTIGSFQAIKHKAASMVTLLEASRAATYYAALQVDGGGEEAQLAAGVAKAYVGESAGDVVAEGLQIHGGIGFTWEHDIHLYLRRTKSNEALFGDPTWHRERIARSLGA